MDSKTKIAIIGVGRWGKNLLKEFSEQAEVVYACHTGNAETVRFLKENYPAVKNTTSLEEILSDGSINAVVIATPINTHFEIAEKALRAGKHVFLEKPGGKEKKELEVLVKEADSRNLILSIGYVFAHNPALTKIKKLMAGKTITSLHFEWFKWGSFEEHPLKNLLPHDISILISLGLFPLEKTFYNENPGANILEIGLTSGRANIHIYFNRISLEKRKTATIEIDEEIYIWNNNSLFKINREKKEIEEIALDNSLSPVAVEIKDFLRSIEEKNQPRTNGEFAVKVWEGLEKIQTS